MEIDGLRITLLRPPAIVLSLLSFKCDVKSTALLFLDIDVANPLDLSLLDIMAKLVTTGLGRIAPFKSGSNTDSFLTLKEDFAIFMKLTQIYL